MCCTETLIQNTVWVKISIEFDPFSLSLQKEYWVFTDVLTNKQISPLMQLMPVMDLFGAFSLLITLVKVHLIEKPPLEMSLLSLPEILRNS